MMLSISWTISKATWLSLSPDQGRIGRRLKKLVALGAAIGKPANSAAAFSGNVSTFTTNVIELAEKLGIPY